MTKAIELINIKKSFKASLLKPPADILKNLNFSINTGTITGFLGANGAGKTTSFKCILGLIYPDQGQISFFGQGPLNPSIKCKIGFMPERPQFPEYLTGEEFLRYYLGLYKSVSNKEAKEKVEAVLKRVKLYDARKRFIKNYSKGMVQRVGIAQAIIHDPDLVILDEPMSGLDPDGRYEVSQLILDIHKSGKTIFFSSHLLDDVQKLCDDLVIIKSGEALFQGTKSQFMNQFKNLFRITYLEENKSKVIEIESIDVLNKKLDELRSKSLQVIEVSSKNTLEQAYVSFQRGEHV